MLPRAQAATPEPQAKTPGVRQAVHTQNFPESRRCKRVLLTSDGGEPWSQETTTFLRLFVQAKVRTIPTRLQAASANRDGRDVVAKGFPTTSSLALESHPARTSSGMDWSLDWSLGPASFHMQSHQYTNGIAHRRKSEVERIKHNFTRKKS